ncbi:UGSC family (seleno)protein [Lawsonibacter sp. LCP25S3_G6]|uniref:UGSC family (seleno)protein n=1 Tax=unclassified Lawsonibacter TaxID=2617946 RepID=UPI003F9A106D
MSNQLHALLDPRGYQEREIIQLAKRPSLDELKNGKILFYNNTKLGFCNYYTVFDRIKERLREIGCDDTKWVEYTETVRGKNADKLMEYAKMLAEEKPVAAIVAFGDMGTSSSTTVLTIALEKIGIPAVYMTAPPGTAITEGVGVYRAGNLCLCSVDIYQASTVEEVAAQVDLKWDYILKSLTSNGEELAKLAHIDFKMDKVAPAKDGLLPFVPEYDEEKSKEPGAYMEEINRYFNEMHISDGLPIIPPTKRRYEAMMEYCPWDESMKLVDPSGPSGREITVKDVAIAAIMAGCTPQAMPVLVSAFKALNSPLYNFNQSVTTSHPGGNLCIVSGPIAQEIGISGKQGCQGPGWPANATIGRAINLVIMNVLRSVPGVCDLDCIASQAEFTYCFAEEPSLAQWNMINEDRFNSETTTVYLLKAEPIHDIIDFLSLNGYDLLDTITACCTTLGSNNAYMPGPLIVCLTPDHAMMLKKAGYTKEMIQEHIHQYVYHQTPMVNGRGLMPVRPKEWANRHPLPVTRSPKDVEVVTIGGRGGHSGVILPWALHSEGCVEALTLPDGTVAKSIEDFKRK